MIGQDSISPSSAYHIFERLNTGGVLLQPQEIRSCIYHGTFVELLESLNNNEDWRKLFGTISPRMRDRELILRFLALYINSNDYVKPMKEFLNNFSNKYRSVDSETESRFISVFSSTVRLIHKAIGDQAFKMKRTVNAALCDAVMVGVARRLDYGEIKDVEAIKLQYEQLFQDTDFMSCVDSHTTDKEYVQKRINKAIEAFRCVK